MANSDPVLSRAAVAKEVARLVVDPDALDLLRGWVRAYVQTPIEQQKKPADARTQLYLDAAWLAAIYEAEYVENMPEHLRRERIVTDGCKPPFTLRDIAAWKIGFEMLEESEPAERLAKYASEALANVKGRIEETRRPLFRVVVTDAGWPAKRTAKFDPAADPIRYAREWVEGYVFRLGEAERARHYPNATMGDYQNMLRWADDPKADRMREAIDVLRDRIKKHKNPAYTPELLLLEHDRLFDIPVHSRLQERFADRFHAWIDRVETYLSIGSADGDAKHRASADGGEFRPAAWFKNKIAARLRKAASKKRKSKRVATKMIDDVVCYSVDDVRQWWPADVPKEA